MKYRVVWCVLVCCCVLLCRASGGGCAGGGCSGCGCGCGYGCVCVVVVVVVVVVRTWWWVVVGFWLAVGWLVVVVVVVVFVLWRVQDDVYVDSHQLMQTVSQVIRLKAPAAAFASRLLPLSPHSAESLEESHCRQHHQENSPTSR